MKKKGKNVKKMKRNEKKAVSGKMKKKSCKRIPLEVTMMTPPLKGFILYVRMAREM